MAEARRPIGGNEAGPPIEALSPVLGHRIRLGICVLLASSSKVSFRRLRDLLGETDGSLGANLLSLEQAEFVAASRKELDGRAATFYALTPLGRRTVKAHLAALEAMIDFARTPRAD